MELVYIAIWLVLGAIFLIFNEKEFLNENKYYAHNTTKKQKITIGIMLIIGAIMGVFQYFGFI